MGGWERLLVAHGPWALFVWAWAESVFFPIPPDVLLIPLCLSHPQAWPAYAAIATGGSVLGGLAGYGLGWYGGRPLLRRFFAAAKVRRVEDFFAAYGVWAVLVAGFTPIPFKVFTVTAGAFRMDLPSFVASAAASRAARFFLVAWLLARFGPQAVALFTGTLAWLSLPALLLVFFGYQLWYRRRQTGGKHN